MSFFLKFVIISLIVSLLIMLFGFIIGIILSGGIVLFSKSKDKPSTISNESSTDSDVQNDKNT